jgi:hypothetical protein
MQQPERPRATLGDNVEGGQVTVEVRLFNSLSRYQPDLQPRVLALPAGATVAELLEAVRVPRHEIFLLLRNGRDISPGLYEAGNINTQAPLDDGDVIALSGPVPYSYGYGAPIV